MKKFYEAPTSELVYFLTEDVITTSDIEDDPFDPDNKGDINP